VNGKGDISYGHGSDPKDYVGSLFDAGILSKFEIFSYRNAAGILASSFPKQFEDILRSLRAFEISETMIRVL